MGLGSSCDPAFLLSGWCTAVGRMASRTEGIIACCRIFCVWLGFMGQGHFYLVARRTGYRCVGSFSPRAILIPAASVYRDSTGCVSDRSDAADRLQFAEKLRHI